MCILKWSYN